MEVTKSMSLLATIPTASVPVEYAVPLKGLGIVGKPEQKEVSDGKYVQVSIPLYYVADKENPDNRVDGSIDAATLSAAAQQVTDTDSAKAVGLSTFFARILLKPEWFTDEFLANFKAGLVDRSDEFGYRINVGKLTRHLFKALGSETIDFDALPAGAIIGFKASGTKKDPERLQIQDFYPVSQ